MTATTTRTITINEPTAALLENWTKDQIVDLAMQAKADHPDVVGEACDERDLRSKKKLALIAHVLADFVHPVQRKLAVVEFLER